MGGEEECKKETNSICRTWGWSGSTGEEGEFSGTPRGTADENQREDSGTEHRKRNRGGRRKTEGLGVTVSTELITE